MMPKNLVLVRHGESEGNVVMAALKKGDDSLYTEEFKKRHDSDYRLTENGIKQVRATNKYIDLMYGKEYFDVGFVSSYRRALETASHIKNVQWIDRVELIERDWGELGRLSPKERDLVFPGWRETKKDVPFYWKPENGENMADVYFRVKIFLDTLHREYYDKNVIVVCHGETMWAFKILLEKIGPIEYARLDQSKNQFDRIHNCQLIHYTRENPFIEKNREKNSINAGKIYTKMTWVKSVCPWDMKKSLNEWIEIQHGKKYSSAELGRIVDEIPKLFEK